MGVFKKRKLIFVVEVKNHDVLNFQDSNNNRDKKNINSIQKNYEPVISVQNLKWKRKKYNIILNKTNKNKRNAKIEISISG